MTRESRPRLLSAIPLGLALVASCSDPTREAIEQAVQTYAVARGDLKVSVVEKAEIQAAQQVTVTSKVEGRTTLIFLAPEGSVVETGDRLAQLDVSSLDEKRSRQAIAVAKAEAALQQARKSLEIMEEDLAAERNSAENTLRIAQLEQQKFLGRLKPEEQVYSNEIEGTNLEMISKLRVLLQNDPQSAKHADLEGRVLDLLGPEENHHRDMGQMANDILQKIDEIRLARAELELKLDTYNHSKSLASRGFITRNELERDKLNYESELSKVDLAWNDLNLLINYTLLQSKIQLNQDVENANLDLISTIGNNESRRVREEVELKSKTAELELAVESLEHWDLQVKNGVVLAPNPGLVVYAKQSRRWNASAVEEGMEVRKGQSLINLPDLTYMIAKLKIQESDVDSIEVNQPAMVVADAFPERAMMARVSRVAPLPNSGSRWSSDLKVYETTIELDGTNEDMDLRPGMNATVEIVVDILRDVLSIPMPAVQRTGKSHYVWKLTGSGPVATQVRIGANSLTHVQIVEGLREGDLVYLVVPPGTDEPEFPDDSSDTTLLDNYVGASPGR